MKINFQRNIGFILLAVMLVFTPQFSQAQQISPAAITQSISVADLVEYPTESHAVQELILNAVKLSQKNLTYLYGSSDPELKGMDCSGTIYYLLNQSKLSGVPRSAAELYSWIEQKGQLYKVTNNNVDSSEFLKLQPGDLLFWSGTYDTHKDSTVSHVMLYLGKNKLGQRLMFGSSDGRSYQGKRMLGVSLFDFKLPDQNTAAKFVGYGCIPGLSCD